MNSRSRTTGFTLTEIIIVMAIIGILAAIMIPSYSRYTLKSNRADAFAALNEVMQAEERYAATNGTYTELLTDMFFALQQPSAQGRFIVEASVCDAAPIAQCVLLTATAQDAQTSDKNSADGTQNVPITLDSRGNRVGWGN